MQWIEAIDILLNTLVDLIKRFATECKGETSGSVLTNSSTAIRVLEDDLFNSSVILFERATAEPSLSQIGLGFTQFMILSKYSGGLIQYGIVGRGAPHNTVFVLHELAHLLRVDYCDGFRRVITGSFTVTIVPCSAEDAIASSP
jgi:hypothetical protein